jgi:hypothetical protein
MRCKSLLVSSFFIVLCLLAACRKPKSDDTPGSVDSLTQTAYNIYRSGAAKETGNILTAPFNLNGLYDSTSVMVMDGDGHLKLQQNTSTGVMNFRRWTINGQTRYTWFVFDASLYDPLRGGSEPGHVILADENLNQIGRFNLLASGGVTDLTHSGLDGHDFILLGDDHYIAMAYISRTVTNVPANLSSSGTAFVATPVIQEVQQGKVVWQWEGSDHAEFYSSSVEGNTFSNQAAPQDYMHMNSMFIDSTDGNLICSFRNCDQIVKINRNTGDIIWHLGGSNSDFPLSADMQFLRQHHATLTDGGHTLLVFDNGDLSLRPSSRILEFQLDEEYHTVSGFKSYMIPEPFTRYMGSVQKIGDHYFIGGGSANYILEVNYVTGEKILEMTSAMSSYRAYKY